MKIKNEADVKEILFHYAEIYEMTDSESTEKEIRGFLYRKKQGVREKLYSDGVYDEDEYLSFVTDESEIKKGDRIAKSGKVYMVTEVSPLLVFDGAAGAVTRVIPIEN